jgi:hypothetical protein
MSLVRDCGLIPSRPQAARTTVNSEVDLYRNEQYIVRYAVNMPMKVQFSIRYAYIGAHIEHLAAVGNRDGEDTKCVKAA